jgi:hypothetical protein
MISVVVDLKEKMATSTEDYTLILFESELHKNNSVPNSSISNNSVEYFWKEPVLSFYFHL